MEGAEEEEDEEEAPPVDINMSAVAPCRPSANRPALPGDALHFLVHRFTPILLPHFRLLQVQVCLHCWLLQHSCRNFPLSRLGDRPCRRLDHPRSHN
jgi:hypothetical protein